MNNLQEIYNGYLAVELEKRKIAEKICDKERSIRRLEKQIKKLEHKRYSDGWVKCLVEPLAKVLTPLLGCEKYEIYGPFGLRAYVSIHFEKPNAKNEYDCYSLSLTCSCEYNDDNNYKGEYCSSSMKSVSLNYDTGKRTQEYPQGSIGWLNGFDVIEKPLPNDINEIIKIIKKEQ